MPAKSPTEAKKFAAFGLETRADLLVHYPWRYADSREVTDIASLAIGLNVALVARVRGAQISTQPGRASRGSRRRSRTAPAR